VGTLVPQILLLEVVTQQMIGDFMHDTLTTLTELLRELPGIGPRQARRLAYWFVRRDVHWVERFAHALVAARNKVKTCDLCMRLFPSEHATQRCTICSNHHRDAHTLLVVEKDVDLENVEKTGTYKGRYFVLGGTASNLDKEPERKIRIRELVARVNHPEHHITEIILALSATTEGEDTVAFVKEQIEPSCSTHTCTVTVLGRGLSTGTELEYVDADTMKSALRGRS
jgi:recombination protein RecR